MTHKYVDDNKPTEIPHDEVQNKGVDPTSESSTVLSLLKQNEEFKQFMVQQHNVMAEWHNENVELQLKNQELNQQLIAVMKDSNGTVINNTINRK